MVSAYKAVSARNWEQVTKLVHVITKFRLSYHQLGKILIHILRIGWNILMEFLIVIITKMKANYLFHSVIIC